MTEEMLKTAKKGVSILNLWTIMYTDLLLSRIFLQPLCRMTISTTVLFDKEFLHMNIKLAD